MNEYLSEVPMCKKKAILVLHFMAYARKVPVKKAKLKTYRDMAKHLWNTYTKLPSDYARIDIIFDLHYQGNNRTEEIPWKELAQIYLDQNNNFLLTQKKFGQLVKIK